MWCLSSILTSHKPGQHKHTHVFWFCLNVIGECFYCGGGGSQAVRGGARWTTDPMLSPSSTFSLRPTTVLQNRNWTFPEGVPPRLGTPENRCEGVETSPPQPRPGPVPKHRRGASVYKSPSQQGSGGVNTHVNNDGCWGKVSDNSHEQTMRGVGEQLWGFTEGSISSPAARQGPNQSITGVFFFLFFGSGSTLSEHI